MIELGASVRRVEDGPLITGAGSYVADLIASETLHCAFVRSPIAHGTFEPPSLDEAMAMPGVVAAYLADTVGVVDLPSSPGRGAPEAIGMGQPALARDRVRYLGEPIAVVVAETARQAVDAADLVWVEFETLPAVTTALAALDDETILFPELGTNVVQRTTIGTGGPAPKYERETSVEIDIPRVSPVTIEPLAILAKPNGEGLDIWVGHQSPGRIPDQIGSLIGMAPALIRARVPDVGGAFGTKGQLYAEYPVVAAIAHKLGRPAVWIQRRPEQLMSGTHGRGQLIRVRIGGDADGRIRGIHYDGYGDIGAYPNTGSRVPFFSAVMSQGLYDIEFVEARAVAVVTNKAPTGPYRGAGRPEAAIAIERAVDAFAALLGMKPEEVRFKNYIPTEALPFKTQTGITYDSGDYAQALSLALESVEIDKWRTEQAERRSRGGDPIGIGIGTFVERAGGAPGSFEYGKVELRSDGSVEIWTGSTSAGQSHKTVWSQIAASVFSVPIESIVFHAGDTGEVADSFGSFGSRSLQVGGSAILRTAREVVNTATKIAAEMMESAEADLELFNGSFRVVGSPESAISLAAVAAEAGRLGIDLSAHENFVPDALTFPYGAYIAVVEVELETGEVKLLRLVAVDDCGNVINPMVVEGQLHGSVMQGIGQSLLEAIVYDDDGQLLTSNMVTYLIPSATQHVPLVSKRLVHPPRSNPLGAKGSGEAGCIGVPPAMLNAVHDALRPHGVTSISFPLTAGRVWEAIHQAQQDRIGAT